MAQTGDFRSAFNGFNREDVVRYLEYLQNRHGVQLQQLQTELTAVQAECDRLRQAQEALEDLRAQYQALEAERDAALSRAGTLEAERNAALTRAEALEQALCAARTERPEQPRQTTDGELEAYRRAERAERQAQQRAEQLMAQANGVLADAGVRADESAQRIGALADQVAAQLAALQQAVIGSKAVLQETAVAMFAIRPDQPEHS